MTCREAIPKAMAVLKPCPFCGASMIEKCDAHGIWRSHENAHCIISDLQIFNFDADEITKWNARTEPVKLFAHGKTPRHRYKKEPGLLP
jgi:hypothetical protein